MPLLVYLKNNYNNNSTKIVELKKIIIMIEIFL